MEDRKVRINLSLYSEPKVGFPLSYTCYYCDTDTDSAGAHSITVYDRNGVEERIEVLCDACYEEWLASLKG